MKNILKIKFLIVVAICLTSCEKWIDPKINEDPNNPISSPIKLILPAAQAGIAYSAGGELSRYTGYWVQHITGVATHAARHETYGTGEDDVENLWRYYTYAGSLMDLNRIILLSTSQKSPHYSGVAKVLTAYKLGVTTDMWGDVPFKDAFQGDKGNITAKYQKQEEIYKELFKLLDDAIKELKEPKSTSSPAKDDLIYGGKLDKWIKLAYSLKARFSIHLSKRKGETAYTDALAAIPLAFSSNSDDMLFKFGDSKTEASPLFQYEDQRGGYIGGVGKYLVDLLKNGGDTDPRLAVYATSIEKDPKKPKRYEGLEPGATSKKGKSFIGNYFTKRDATVSPVTYTELKFIEAEAYFSKSAPDKAKSAEAYNNAVKASLARYGVSNKAWEAKNAAETGVTITLEKIMKAKYIATFMQDETFSDWRRHSSIFNLKLAKGARTKSIPRRLPYPQSEREYNKSNLPTGNVSLTDKVWWDN